MIEKPKLPVLTKQETWDFTKEAAKLVAMAMAGEVTEEEFDAQLDQLVNYFEKQRVESFISSKVELKGK